MAAPTYTWRYHGDLYGANRVPTIQTLGAKLNLETKEGTLVNMSSGQVQAAGDSAASLCGLAAEETAAALAADAAIRIAILFPGAIIVGTADADASALSGFNGKKADLNADGSLDVADTTNGCLSVLRTENSGLTVYCVVTEFDHGCVN